MDFNKQELYDFIEWMIKAGVGDETIFFDDLHIAGMDATELMTQIAARYQVDMADFGLTVYKQDDYGLGNIFLTIFRFISNRQALRKRSFSMAHLHEVIRRGKWFDPHCVLN